MDKMNMKMGDYEPPIKLAQGGYAQGERMYTAMGVRVFPVPDANSITGMTYKDSNGVKHEFDTSSILATGLIDSNWKIYEEGNRRTYGTDLTDLVMEYYNEI